MPFKPLPCKRVRCALEKHLGFTEEKSGATSHEKYTAIRKGRKYVVTVDCHRGEVRALDVDSIIGQAGVSKKDFYRAIDLC